jgi:hypothetical protein
MLSPEEIMAWSLGPALPPQLESPTTAGDDSVDSAAMPDESIVRSTDGDRAPGAHRKSKRNACSKCRAEDGDHRGGHMAPFMVRVRPDARWAVYECDRCGDSWTEMMDGDKSES